MRIKQLKVKKKPWSWKNNTNPPNISSKDSQEDIHYQDDRSHGGWMGMDDRSQEHQDDEDIEMKTLTFFLLI